MKPRCVTIQMKATEQYFHAVLFIMLYKVVLTFKSVECVATQMKAIEQYFHVVLLIMLYKVDVDKTLACKHSNQWAEGTVYYAKFVLTFK